MLQLSLGRLTEENTIYDLQTYLTNQGDKGYAVYRIITLGYISGEAPCNTATIHVLKINGLMKCY